MKRGFFTLLATALSFVLVAGSAQAAPLYADIVTLVDESGSMATEHEWLPGMIQDLEAGLIDAGVGAGVTPNLYAAVGYGGHVSGDDPHKHDFGTGNDWFGADDYSNDFVTSGGTEDGWEAIDFFFEHYTTRPNAALNLILVTDEDRDDADSGGDNLTYSGILDQLTDANALLNVVVNADFECGDGTDALGIDASGTGYVADGSGGFTTCSGATATGGFGSTVLDYVNLALATGGAAWNLNALRNATSLNAPLAQSFTSAFINIKVQEIQAQTPGGSVPVPAPLALLGAGLVGWIGSRRLRR